MNTTNATSETIAPKRKGLKPYQLSIALGIGIGTFAMLSGILPHIVHWHNDDPISRKVFEGIPGYIQIAFYTIIPALLVFGSFQFANRIRNWERGAPDRRKTTKKNFKVCTCARCFAIVLLDSCTP
jgi:hypothetical protein